MLSSQGQACTTPTEVLRVLEKIRGIRDGDVVRVNHEHLGVLGASSEIRFQVQSTVILFKYQTLKPGGAFKLGSSLHLRPHLREGREEERVRLVLEALYGRRRTLGSTG